MVTYSGNSSYNLVPGHTGVATGAPLISDGVQI